MSGVCEVCRARMATLVVRSTIGAGYFACDPCTIKKERPAAGAAAQGQIWVATERQRNPLPSYQATLMASGLAS